ncbi:hypothetical protein EON80_27025, partial [bacterium]
MKLRQSLLLPCLIAFLGAVSANAQAPNPGAVPAVPAPARKLPFEDEIIAFEEADKETPPPLGGVLFTGSSNIRIWTTLA